MAINVHFKAVFNFQSAEFDYSVGSPQDIEAAMIYMNDLLEGLQEVAPEQEKQFGSQKKVQKVAPKKNKEEERPSESQINCLKRLGIDEEYARGLQKMEAADLIRELVKVQK